MQTSVAKVLAMLNSKVGRCAVCMRKSFSAALVSWLVASFLMVALGNKIATDMALSLAVALTALWLAHLTAYAVRAASPKSPPRVAAPSPAWSRRDFLPTFGKVFAGVALATALPGLAFAQDRLRDCLTCCAKYQNSCGNDGDCNVNYQNCVANCNSQGETPSTWRCW